MIQPRGPSLPARAAALLLALVLPIAWTSVAPARAAISRSQELKAQAFSRLTDGIKALRDGDPEKAIELLKQVTEVALNSFRASYYLGLAYRADRQYSKAIENISFALELNPTHLQAHVDLGDCYLAVGDIPEALAEYHRARSIQERYAPAWDGIARAAEARGDDDEAISHFKTAIELNPGFPNAALNLGDLYLRRARLREAVDLFLQAIEIRPNFAAAYNRLGVAYSRQKLANEAIAALRRAAELEKGNPWHPYTIGVIEMDLGYLGQALRDFDAAIRLDVDYLEAYAAKARLLRRLGDFRGAVTLLEATAERPTEDVKLRREIDALLGEVQTQWERHDELAWKMGAGAATPEELRELARLRAEIGDHARAAETLRVVIDTVDTVDPNSRVRFPAQVTDLFQFGYYLLRGGSYEEAERVFRQVVERRPGSPAALLNLGLSLQGQGKGRLAEEVLAEARALAPEDTSVLIALGNARLREGDYGGAAEAFSEALSAGGEFDTRGRVETILKMLEKYGTVSRQGAAGTAPRRPGGGDR